MTEPFRMPRDLEDEKKLLWKNYYKILSAKNAITPADSSCLNLLVDCHSQYDEACQLVKDTDKRKLTEVGRAIAIREKAFQRLLKMLKEVGLTPKSRNKIGSAEVDTENKDDGRFFK